MPDFTVDIDLNIGKGVSKACQSIFRQDIAGQKLGSVLNLKDGKEDFLKMGLIQVFENFLPIEVNISLLPKQVVSNHDLFLQMRYTLVLENDTPSQVTIIATDATDLEIERKKLKDNVILNQLIINCSDI